MGASFLDHHADARDGKNGECSTSPFYFSNEAEIAETVKQIPDLGRRELNLSRLRQAWDAAKKGLSAADTRKRRGIDDADIDNVLPAPELTGLKNDFYARCGLVVCSV